MLEKGFSGFRPDFTPNKTGLGETGAGETGNGLDSRRNTMITTVRVYVDSEVARAMGCSRKSHRTGEVEWDGRYFVRTEPAPQGWGE